MIVALLGLTAAGPWSVHRPVLFPVLPHPGPEGRRQDRQPADRRRALLIGTPFFIFFGSLSDKIGRKWIIMAGCALAVLTYFPIFKAITHYANPALERAQQSAQIVVTADPAQCSFGQPDRPRDRLPQLLRHRQAHPGPASASYEVVSAPAGTVASVKIGDKEIPAFNAGLTEDRHSFSEDSKKQIAGFKKSVGEAMSAAGYPSKADPAQMNTIMVLVLLVIPVIYVTMVYGPIAAMLVEMFPTRIRYTSMSLPYHIGNGWFGGLLPTISFALVAQNGNIYYGLWYPIIIAAVTFVIGALFVRETKDVNIYAHD